MGKLYKAPPGERRRLHEALWHRQQKAHNAPEVHCDPHLLRDIILHNIPPFRAPGADDIPSQCLKDLGWGGICEPATLFSELTNHADYRSDKKPTAWNNALVYLLPKEPGATSLQKHRPISLMSQVQKFYTRWLTTEVGMASEAEPIGEQHGFRKSRQALRTLFLLTAFKNARNPKFVRNLSQRLFLGVPVRGTEIWKNLSKFEKR